MELFKRELQDNPKAMLWDVVRLYMLTYGVGEARARKDVKRDLDLITTKK